MTKNGDSHWSVTREKVLFIAGLFVIGYTMIISPLLHEDFHPEFLLLGGALCGVSITQWGDKK